MSKKFSYFPFSSGRRLGLGDLNNNFGIGISFSAAQAAGRDAGHSLENPILMFSSLIYTRSTCFYCSSTASIKTVTDPEALEIFLKLKNRHEAN
jgi:hypothetical protein